MMLWYLQERVSQKKISRNDATDKSVNATIIPLSIMRIVKEFYAFSLIMDQKYYIYTLKNVQIPLRLLRVGFKNKTKIYFIDYICNSKP